MRFSEVETALQIYLALFVADRSETTFRPSRICEIGFFQAAILVYKGTFEKLSYGARLFGSILNNKYVFKTRVQVYSIYNNYFDK